MSAQDAPGFFDAVQRVLAHEGGYVCDPNDPGGETNFGLSHRSYPDLDLKALTREQAIEVYYTDFWLKYDLDQLPLAIGAKVLDLAANMGHWAIICLQRACRANGQALAEDGVVGNLTKDVVKALAYQQPTALMAALRAEAAGHYRLIVMRQPSDSIYLRGWENRAYE